MNSIIIENIPFMINDEHLLSGLKVRPGTSLAAKLTEISKSATNIARPKVAIKLLDITNLGDDFVTVDNITLNSRILSVNLKDSPNMAIFAATCGTELDEWSKGFDGYLEQYWADTIMFLALGTAMQAAEGIIKNTLDAETVSTMNPGSLEDWPITEQSKLFTLMKDETAAIGVRLNESFLMRPLKSVSGLSYASGEIFHNCQLCPRKDCPGRRAPFDKGLYEKRYKTD